MTVHAKIVLNVSENVVNGVRSATYRCPSPTCLKNHIIAMCDDRFMDEVPGFRAAWIGFLKQAIASIGKKTIEDSGGTLDKFSVDEVKDLN